MNVCMFVLNNCKRDARVLKEAKTLAEAGYDVRIIAILDKEREPLPVKFLTKQLLLINNLANSYWDKAESWASFK